MRAVTVPPHPALSPGLSTPMTDPRSRSHLGSIAASLAAALSLGLSTSTATAALEVGEAAPDFTIQAAVDGKTMDFSLAKALETGPVVLYFFPASFTEGCTIEAHLFSEAIKDFKTLGATVIGVSRDDIDTQKRFSVAACRGQFAVGADPDHKVMKAYDTLMTLMPTYSNRTSYVIGSDRRIAYEYTSLSPKQHVEKTLAAVRALKSPGSGSTPGASSASGTPATTRAAPAGSGQ